MSVFLYPFKAPPSNQDGDGDELINPDALDTWEWTEILLLVAAVASLVFVIAALYLIRAHKKQWNKMQQMDHGKYPSDVYRMVIDLVYKWEKCLGCN